MHLEISGGEQGMFLGVRSIRLCSHTWELKTMRKKFRGGMQGAGWGIFAKDMGHTWQETR